MKDPTPSQVLGWTVVVVVLSIVTYVLVTAFRVADVSVDREVIAGSRQYAASNTTSFYDRLDAIKKIDVQIAGLPPGDPQVEPLKSQRELMVGEARRAVAEIPAGSRTPDMNPYLPGAQ